MFRGVLFRLLLGYFLLVGPAAFSQSDTKQINRLNLKFSPQHLLINGFLVDVEKPLKRYPRQSLIISPRFYAGKTRTVDLLAGRRDLANDNSKISGYGAEVQHRLYLSRHTDIARERVYLAYGFNFHYFREQFNRPGWAEELADDGLLYYRHHQLLPYHERINQWGSVAMFGAQNLLFTNRMLWDIFLGLGYKNSHRKTNYSTLRFNQNAFDFGYTGAYFLVGFKVGVAL